MRYLKLFEDYNKDEYNLVPIITDNKITYKINDLEVGYIDYYYDGGVISEYLTEGCDSEFYIGMIKVYKPFRGNDYSSLMLNHVKKYAKSIGADIITMRVDTGLGTIGERNSDIGLEKLYLKNGFRYSFSEKECVINDVKCLGAMEFIIDK